MREIRHLRKPLTLEAIVGMFLKDGELKFLVQWKNRPFREATFETPSDFDDSYLFLQLARKFEADSNHKLLSILSAHQRNSSETESDPNPPPSEVPEPVWEDSSAFPEYFDSEDEIHIVGVNRQQHSRTNPGRVDFGQDSLGDIQEIEIVQECRARESVIPPRQMWVRPKMSVYPTLSRF